MKPEKNLAVLVENGNITVLLRTILDLLIQDPSRFDLAGKYLEIVAEFGSWREVSHALKRLRPFVSFPDAAYSVAWSARRAGRLKEATVYASQVPEDSPYRSNALYIRAQSFLLLGKEGHAGMAIEELSRLEGRNSTVVRMLEVLKLREAKNYKQARNLLNEIDADPDWEATKIEMLHWIAIGEGTSEKVTGDEDSFEKSKPKIAADPWNWRLLKPQWRYCLDSETHLGWCLRALCCSVWAGWKMRAKLQRAVWSMKSLRRRMINAG